MQSQVKQDNHTINHQIDNVDDAQEEDWSEIMSAAGLAGGSFAQHDLQDIQLPNQKTISIASTASLSPLDMVDLSWGTHDATGHRIWMGAELWIEALPFLGSVIFTSQQETTSSAPCRCLELGSGTGLAGISLVQYFGETMSFQLILSDNSQSALDLCRFNCQQNGLDDNSESRPSSIQFELLPWGSSLTEDMMGTMDVVFATDVIYDADAWSPLLETAKTSLRRSGHLIVSHVPRAALPVAKPTGGEPKQYHEALESFLVDTATLHGFSLQSTLRPTDLPCFKTQHEEMQQAGAAIFIFQLTTSSP